MEITSARWRLPGVEAVYTDRALERDHGARYCDCRLP